MKYTLANSKKLYFKEILRLSTNTLSINMTSKNLDIHSKIKEILKSRDFSIFASSEEFCFYVANGGYEKISCGKLAYLLSKKLESKKNDILICLEVGKKRFDIVVSKKKMTFLTSFT